MDKNKMIPPKIWETDCKYCRFRDSEENFEYGTGKNKYDTPCKIGIFSGRSLHWNDNTKSFDLTDQEVYTEHCVDRMNFMESVECVSISMAFIRNRNTRTEYIAHTQKDRKTAVMLCHI